MVDGLHESTRQLGQPLFGAGASRAKIRVSRVTDTREARFCESVESGHSDQDQSAEIAAQLGITAEPFRIDSQCKYAAIARPRSSSTSPTACRLSGESLSAVSWLVCQ